MSAVLPPAILLMGPTASGKTRLAIELAARGPFDIISVDSGMVYRGPALIGECVEAIRKQAAR